MDWYKVPKRINGRHYDYWQRTYRVGKSVKTENKYIGPSGRASTPAGSSNVPHASTSRLTLLAPLVDVSPTAPRAPEEVLHQLRPFHGLTGNDYRDYRKQREQERRGDELIQYGNLKDRIKRHAARYRAAKRKTKGIKALNPFMAQALVKKHKD